MKLHLRILKIRSGKFQANSQGNYRFFDKKRHPREISWMSWNVDIIVLINVLSAVVAIQSNVASLIFLGQLCIAYLYATKVARAIPIAHRQFSYKKTPCKLQSVFVCTLLSSNELTFRELASFASFLKTWFGKYGFQLD